MQTSDSFYSRFATHPDLAMFCSYFELLYDSYDRSWTDRMLLQARVDALIRAGFTFNRENEIAKQGDPVIDLNRLDDSQRTLLFEKLFTEENLNLMVWWIYMHLGTQWLKYIRGIDLFLNSMRMVGEVSKQSVGSPTEDEEDPQLKKIKIYLEASRVEQSLSEQKRALFMGTDTERDLLDVVLVNREISTDVEMTQRIKELKKK